MAKFNIGDKVKILAGSKCGKTGKVESSAPGPLGGEMYHIRLDDGYLTDAAERNISLANSCVSSNAVRSRNAVVQKALNAVARNETESEARDLAGKLRAIRKSVERLDSERDMDKYDRGMIEQAKRFNRANREFAPKLKDGVILSFPHYMRDDYEWLVKKFKSQFYDRWAFNAAANARRAKNALPRGGNYEVTLETVTLKGNTTSTATMTDAQLKSWLGLIHCGGLYAEASARFARGEKYYDANVDMHPTVHIKPIL